MAEGDSFKLEYKPRAGETLRYGIAVNTEQFIREGEIRIEQHYTIEMVMAQTITEVEGSGLFTVDYTLESGIMRNGEKETPVPGIGDTVTAKLRSNGEIVCSTLPLPFSAPSFPGHELQPGDTWTHRSPVQLPFAMEIKDSSTEEITIETEYEVEEIEQIFERECIRIAVKCPEKTISVEPDFMQIIEGSGTLFFDANDGILYSFHNRTYNEIRTGEGKTELTVSTSLELL